MEVNSGSSHTNTFNEIDVPEQLVKCLEHSCREIPFLLILKPDSQHNFIINELFHDGSSKDFDKSFSYLLQFLRTLKNTLILQNILHGCLPNQNKDKQKIVIKSKCQI